MRYRVAIATAAAVVAITAFTTGCSSNTADAPTPAQSSASQTVTGNAAEIAFAQLMIPHHQQAVEMADLALQDSDSAQIKSLATQIKSAQGPEITQMQGWLTQWGAPTGMPTTADSGDMPGMDMGGMSSDGMMTSEQMSSLGSARGADFNKMWLEMMISHHEGAIQMAQDVKAQATNPQVVQLADDIIASQTAEIATMKKELANQG